MKLEDLIVSDDEARARPGRVAPAPKQYTPEDKREAHRLRQQGKTKTEIARAIGASAQTIKAWLLAPPPRKTPVPEGPAPTMDFALYRGSFIAKVDLDAWPPSIELPPSLVGDWTPSSIRELAAGLVNAADRADWLASAYYELDETSREDRHA